MYLEFKEKNLCRGGNSPDDAGFVGFAPVPKNFSKEIKLKKWGWGILYIYTPGPCLIKSLLIEFMAN